MSGPTPAAPSRSRNTHSDTTRFRETEYRTWDALAGAPGPVLTRIDGPDGKRFIWPRGTTVANLVYFSSGPEPPPTADTPRLVVVEGAKAADAVAAAGFAAAGLVCGASSTPGPAVVSLLATYAECVLWPDKDEPGRGLVSRTARELEAAGLRRLRLVDPPADLAEGGDAADLPAERVRALVEGAREIVMLPEAHRPARAWGAPHPPDLAAVLDAVERFVARFVVLPGEAERIAVTLWAAHTYIYDGFDATPYLAILSPEKRSGKTRLLEVLGLLCRDPQPVGGASMAALFRIIDAKHPTILLDEADTVFRTVRGESSAEDIRGLLNNGYRRGQPYLRVVGEGKKMRVEAFDPFCPKAVAAIGDLPDTVLDRAVVIRLQRRRQDEPVEPFRLRRAAEEATPIREALAAALERVTLDEDPPMPPGLSDRAADNWAPLLAVADAAGGTWPTRARRAALRLLGDGDVADERPAIRLLADLKAVFDEEGVDRLPTARLLEALKAMDEAPWASWGREGLKAEHLGRLLRDYRTPSGQRIRSRQMKIAGQNLKGYERRDFEDVWARYVPFSVSDPLLGSEPATPLPPRSDEGESGSGLAVQDPNPLPLVPGFTLEGSGVAGSAGGSGIRADTIPDDAPDEDYPPSALWDARPDPPDTRPPAPRRPGCASDPDLFRAHASFHVWVGDGWACEVCDAPPPPEPGPEDLVEVADEWSLP
ncbi:MAG TPA: DUF3631 domain-containing protein [Candidatus Binatia bacterium]|nr:DUF3631 domain-containing protein [Candidatus Binatia bacterium]